MSSLIKFDPFAEMQALQRQFFGDDWFTSVKGVQLPTTDIYTDDKGLAIEAHLPNFADKDVSVQLLHDNVLEIQAERHEKEEDKKKKYVVRESSSSFYRRLRLPENADNSNIEAKITDGVLHVRIPFKKLPEPKKITIITKKQN
jgi:HSP20 family protein